MPGSNLRLGLSEMGEGIAQGIRFGTANKERILWHREGLRRQDEERKYDEERQLKNALLQNIISDTFEKKRSLKNEAVTTLSDALQFLDEKAYDDPTYLSTRGEVDTIRKAVARGDVDPLSVELPEGFLTLAAKIRAAEANEKTRQFNLIHSDTGGGGGGKDTGKEPQYFVVYNPATGLPEYGEKNRLETIATNLGRLVAMGKATKDEKKKLETINRALAGEVTDKETAMKLAGDASAEVINRNLGAYDEILKKEFPPTENYGGISLKSKMAAFKGEKLPAPVQKATTFNDQLTQADADTQNSFKSYDQKTQDYIKRKVAEGHDLATVMNAVKAEYGK